MPMHDWTLVVAGIYHDFHHAWIEELKRALKRCLPEGYYALAEQHAAGFGPDVLTLQERNGTQDGSVSLLTKPLTRHVIRFDAGRLPRKKSAIAVRHVSDDRVIAMVEVISPGNKASQHAFRALIEKAYDLILQGVHLLLLDPFPPGPRDPNGIHQAIAERIDPTQEVYHPEKPLTFVAYQAQPEITAYIEPISVGESLPEMPLFLTENLFVHVPLESTYRAAWENLPTRWQRVLEPSG